MLGPGSLKDGGPGGNERKWLNGGVFEHIESGQRMVLANTHLLAGSNRQGDKWEPRRARFREQVAALRKLLGERPDGGDWIVNVPRVGYRFTGSAQTMREASTAVVELGPSIAGPWLCVKRSSSGRGPTRSVPRTASRRAGYAEHPAADTGLVAIRWTSDHSALRSVTSTRSATKRPTSRRSRPKRTRSTSARWPSRRRPRRS